MVEGLMDYWPVLLSGVAVIVFAVRQESLGKQVRDGLSEMVAQVKIQNGRIGKLEKWQAYEAGRSGTPFNGNNENGGH